MSIDENLGLSTQDQPVSNDLVNDQVSSKPAETFNRNDYVSKQRVTELITENRRDAATKAAEKARTEMLAERDKQSQNSTGMGGMPSGMTEEKFRQLAAEEFQKQAQNLQTKYEQENRQKHFDNLANDFLGKLDAAKGQYPDLVKRQGEIGELALLVPFINETSEVAGITQHLLDNEAAFANLLMLSQHPNRLRSAIKKIEASIKTNTEALIRSYPKAPLNGVTPSVNSLDSDARPSIEALKKQKFYRG